MGFSVEFHVFLPQEPPEGPHRIWRWEQAFRFPGITRLEKLTAPRFRHIQGMFDPRQRAKICVTSIVLDRLSDKLESAELTHFAPWLLTCDHTGDRAEMIEWVNNGQEFVDCGIPDLLNPSVTQVGNLPIEMLSRHNEFIALGNEDLQERLAVTDMMMGEPPLTWTPATQLAEWLDDAEQGETEAWREIKKLEQSLALARGWREYYREFGRADARVMITFPITWGTY